MAWFPCNLNSNLGMNGVKKIHYAKVAFGEKVNCGFVPDLLIMISAETKSSLYSVAYNLIDVSNKTGILMANNWISDSLSDTNWSVFVTNSSRIALTDTSYNMWFNANNANVSYGIGIAIKF